MKWTEFSIAKTLAMDFFNKSSLVVVDNCGWTGNECDLLVVNRDLRIIDVEIKISRQDLKADAKKDKWRHHTAWNKPKATALLTHPTFCWKHYYVMPEEIWTPTLLGFLPSEHSGVVLLKAETTRNGVERVRYNVVRAAKPNRAAEKITPADAVNIARLASLRMWSHRTKV